MPDEKFIFERRVPVQVFRLSCSYREIYQSFSRYGELRNLKTRWNINRRCFVGKDNIRSFPDKLLTVGDNEEEITKSLFQEMLWIDAKDVW